MKLKLFAFAMLFCMVATSTYAQAPITLKTQKDSASYSYAVIVGQSLKRQLSTELDIDVFTATLTKMLKGEAPQIAPEAAGVCFREFNEKAMAKAGEAAKMEGEKFLAANKARTGVTTTASGLQYEVMKQGTGTESPKATDKVTVHYHGTLINGEVFDSSVERNEPATFGLNQVIPGWTEGVQLMKKGDKFKFFLPYNIAYGERGAGGKIKPYSALVFEVELLEIAK